MIGYLRKNWKDRGLTFGVFAGSCLMVFFWIGVTIGMWCMDYNDPDPTLASVFHHQLRYVEHKLRRII